MNIYDKIDVLIVYDGDTVHRFKKSDGSAYGTADTFSNGFIEVFGNRLYLANTKQIKFSTFNSSTFNNNPFNTIDTDGLIIDKQIIGNALIFFTTHGTYALTGTGYTTMNFPKISEFSPQERVYPAVHMDNTYVIYNGYLRRLTLDGLQETEYNYAVIPDTTRKIYSTERGIIFPLGHATNKYGLLNVEELQNRRLITLTNFYDGDIDSLIEYKGVIFLVCGGVLYKQNGVRSISFKLNKIRFQTKLYRDTVEMGLGGTYPSSITAIVDDVSKTCLKNDGANQVSYNVRDM